MKRGYFLGVLALFYALTFSILTFLSGCASMSKSSDSIPAKSQLLEPQLTMKFADIPIPTGFKFLYKDSYSFILGNMRVAVLKYSGRPDAEQTLTFFKEQMPIYNWNLINTFEYGRRMLNFERDREACVITIEPKWVRTEVVISIGPKQAVSQRTDKPIK